MRFIAQFDLNSNIFMPNDAKKRSCPGAWCKSVALYAAPGG